MNSIKNIFIFGASGGLGKAIIQNLDLDSKPITLHIVMSDQSKEQEILSTLNQINNKYKLNYKIYTQKKFFESEFSDLVNVFILYCWGVFDLSMNQKSKSGFNYAEEYLRINYGLLKKVFLKMSVLKSRINGFLYISSQSTSETVIDYHLIDQLDYQKYGFSKKLAENFLSACSISCEFPIMIVRPGTLLGAGEKNYRLIGQLVRTSLKSEIFKVLAPQSKRDYLSFENLAKFCVFCMNQKITCGYQVIQVAGQFSVSIQEIVNYCSGYLHDNYHITARIEFGTGKDIDVIFNDDSLNFGFRQKNDILDALSQSVDSHMNYFIKKIR